MESNRQKKVARLIQKDLSDIFRQESKTFYQNIMITITQIDIALFDAIIGELTTIFTIRMLLNQKTFCKENEYTSLNTS